MNKNECYTSAMQVLNERRAYAYQLQQSHIKEVYRAIPELKKIDAELKKNMHDYLDFSTDNSYTEEKAKEYKLKSISMQAERIETLYANGYPLDYLDLKFSCPLCNDEGYIGRKTCKCLKNLIALNYLKQSNLATSYKSRTFKNVDISLYDDEESKKTMKLIVSFCKKYVDDFEKTKQNLFFQGVPGCGKTFLSTVIGVELIQKGVFVFYTPAQNMINSFEAEKFGKSIPNTVETDLYSSCELLIIDDLGTEFQTPLAESVIYNVINTRLNMKLPTIISSNYLPVDFAEIYNDRIISRIDYDFTLLSFPDKDLRKQKKEKKRV